MTIALPAFQIEWWQIALTVFYFIIGGMAAGIAYVTTEFERGYGHAFGYPSSSLGAIELILIALIWPLCLAAFLIIFFIEKIKP